MVVPDKPTQAAARFIEGNKLDRLVGEAVRQRLELAINIFGRPILRQCEIAARDRKREGCRKRCSRTNVF